MTWETKKIEIYSKSLYVTNKNIAKRLPSRNKIDDQAKKNDILDDTDGYYIRFGFH